MSHLKDSAFQFTNPVIVSMKYELNPKYNRNSDTIYTRSIRRNISRSKNSNDALLMVTLNIGGEDSTNPWVNVSLTMAANFHWDGSLNEKADDLLKLNGTSLLLGYMRPVISNITAYSPGGSLNIPFMNLVDEVKDD